ncbi:MAG: hypothetical protein L0H19_04770 [Salinisphaera sp.]|nr:hypothetical protein [Salinisphaera sp.]
MNAFPRVPPIVVSVVSHGQAALVERLLGDIECHWNLSNLSVVLTLNIPEQLPFDPAAFSFPVLVLRNLRPKGFGANHNQAFAHSGAELFCVLNPDIRARTDPMPMLRRELRRRNRTGLVAPAIVNSQGQIEDSARRRLTPRRLVSRVVMRRRGAEYAIGREPLNPDWIAGMFLLLRARVFAQAGGFDERYFMYCEDADLCRRVRHLGYRVTLTPDSRVVHDGQRASHSSLRHLLWHISSLLRYMATSPRPADAGF